MTETKAPAAPSAAPVVHPEMAKILAWMASLGLPDVTRTPLDEARRITHRVSQHWNHPKPDLEVVDLTLPRPGGGIPARLYRPGPGKLPVVLFLHGGGWVFGNLETHDRFMRLMAKETGAAVLGIDYRKAPEHPFPAGHDDAMAAVSWLRSDGAARDLDASRIVACGDSAGANLALGLLVGLRQAGLPQIQGAGLFYGCFAPDLDTASHKAFGGGNFGLTTARMTWFWNAFLGGSPASPDLRAAPSRADPAGLPPLYLNAAALDPLLDDTLSYVEKLKAAKVPYQFDLYEGVIHGFMQMGRELEPARRSVSDAARALKGMLKA